MRREGRIVRVDRGEFFQLALGACEATAPALESCEGKKHFAITVAHRKCNRIRAASAMSPALSGSAHLIVEFVSIAKVLFDEGFLALLKRAVAGEDEAVLFGVLVPANDQFFDLFGILLG